MINTTCRMIYYIIIYCYSMERHPLTELKEMKSLKLLKNNRLRYIKMTKYDSFNRVILASLIVFILYIISSKESIFNHVSLIIIHNVHPQIYIHLDKYLFSCFLHLVLKT